MNSIFLLFDLLLCALWLISIDPIAYAQHPMWILPVLRVGLSFLMYRRSRWTLIGIVLVALVAIGMETLPLVGGITSPGVRFLKGCLCFLGLDGRAMAVTESVADCVNVLYWLWLLVWPLALYVYLKVKRRFKAIPQGEVFGRLSRVECTCLAILALLGLGYVCGIGIERKTIITTILLPAAMYTLVAWCLHRRVSMKEMLLILVGGVCFWYSQYATGAGRISLLICSTLLMAIVLVRFVVDTRKWLLGVVLFGWLVLVVPVVCIGYNPYAGLQTKRFRACTEYRYSLNGLLYVRGEDGLGIRDRYKMILPAEFDKVEILQPYKPYFKVRKDGIWRIYDIERQEFVTDAGCEEVIPYGKNSYLLKTEGDTILMVLPSYYDRNSSYEVSLEVVNSTLEE